MNQLVSISNDQKAPANHMLEPLEYSVRETFGLEVNPKATMRGFAPCGHDAVPTSDPNFVFKLDLLREMADFHYTKSSDGLMLSGPTGAGKSSFVREYCARLNIPFYETSACSRTEFESFLGKWIIVNGSFKWIDGPLVRAFRDGGIFLINEIDTMSPEELTGFNGILDGSSLCLREKDGEIIHRNPNFKMIATGNSAGVGDDTGLYQGVTTMNIAFMDRFSVIEVDYMDLEDELKILKAISPEFEWDEVLTEMLKVADDVRTQFKAGKINTTLSTRTMVRWANKALQLLSRSDPAPVLNAIKPALLNRAGEMDKAVIEGLLNTHLSNGVSS